MPQPLLKTDRGYIFNIQRFSLHDGPGIRTTVFMNGCSLRCRWCANPESWRGRPVLFYQPQLCLHCEACVAVCPQNALRAGDYTENRVDRQLCDGCGRCAEVCPAAALTIKGRLMEASAVIAEVLRDQVFYSGGGGVTFSGGEPLCQAGFLLAMLEEAKAHGLHTAIESSGQAPWSSWAAVLPFLDRIYLDIKHVDPQIHRRFTGSGNARIISNLRRLAVSGADLKVRMTLVPGFNSDEASLRLAASLFQALGVRQVELLDYHTLGESKFQFLGQDYPYLDDDRQSADRARLARKIFAEYGIDPLWNL
jgi:pyruvate formate lyase activating enzyme